MQLSYWEKTSIYATADIAIIGAGFLGLFTALAIHKKHPTKRIVVLEKSSWSLGASTRNAGFACFGSPTELLADAEQNGIDAMLSLVEMRYNGIAAIRSLLGDEAIEYDACGGYECISNTLNNHSNIAERIEELNTWVQPVFKTNNTFETVTPLLQKFGLTNFNALFKNNVEGGLHSGKLLLQLQRLVISKGIQILYNHGVTNIAVLNNSVQLQLPQSIFEARQIINCTNAFTNTLLPTEVITPARGQIFVTKPIYNLSLKGTFHYNEGFYYWRNIGDRILLGGARNTDILNEETTIVATTPAIQQQLIHFATQHFVQFKASDIDYCWSGIMGFSSNKLPIVKRINDRVFMAMGCNGIGVALTPIVAQQVAAII